MKGLPLWLSGKEPTCQCRRHKRLRCNPWVRKMPWKRKQQPTPVFLSGESHGEKKGMTEDEMVWCHHQLNGHGFGWTPGDGDGQGGLKCCGSRGCKESDTTERLNWTDWSLVSSYILDHFFLVSITLLLSFHPLLELDISEFPCLIFSLGDFIHSIFSHWTYADDSQIYISHWFSRW